MRYVSHCLHGPLVGAPASLSKHLSQFQCPGLGMPCYRHTEARSRLSPLLHSKRDIPAPYQSVIPKRRHQLICSHQNCQVLACLGTARLRFLPFDRATSQSTLTMGLSRRLQHIDEHQTYVIFVYKRIFVEGVLAYAPQDLVFYWLWRISISFT
jgi:hypothetical protein